MKTRCKAKEEQIKMNVLLHKFTAFNERRYGTPWVCKLDERGNYNFSEKVGIYTGNGRRGEAGDLVVFDPDVKQVYAYGQKDYRGGNTVLSYAVWDGTQFHACDKLGKRKMTDKNASTEKSKR